MVKQSVKTAVRVNITTRLLSQALVVVTTAHLADIIPIPEDPTVSRVVLYIAVIHGQTALTE